MYLSTTTKKIKMGTLDKATQWKKEARSTSRRLSTPNIKNAIKYENYFYYTEDVLYRVVYACRAAFRTNCLDYSLYARMNVNEKRKEK